jgi:hypothetical protein
MDTRCRQVNGIVKHSQFLFSEPSCNTPPMMGFVTFQKKGPHRDGLRFPSGLTFDSKLVKRLIFSIRVAWNEGGCERYSGGELCGETNDYPDQKNAPRANDRPSWRECRGGKDLMGFQI